MMRRGRIKWLVSFVLAVLVVVSALRGFSVHATTVSAVVATVNAAVTEASSASPTSRPSARRRPKFDYASLFSNLPYNGTTHVRSFNESRARESTVAFRSVGGYPLCQWESLCMWTRSSNAIVGGPAGPNVTFRVSGDDAARAERETKTTAHERGCIPTGVSERGKSRVQSWGHQLYTDVLGLFADDAPAQVTWLPGTSLLIDTYLQSPHFGHVANRAVQSRLVLDALAQAGEAPDRIMMFKQSRFPSSRRPLSAPLTSLVVGALGHRWLARNASVFRSDMEAWKIVCMERAIEVRNVFERKFANAQSLERWSHIVREWNPADAASDDAGACADVRAPVVVLQRVEGQGLRAIGDFAVLERVFRELGVCAYVNASFGASATFESQAALFANFSLLVSVHSSQLVNLLWAHPLSATLELRPDKGDPPDPGSSWKRHPSPFCPAYQCHTVFALSTRHGNLGAYRVPSFPLDYGILKNDLEELLAEQARRRKRAGCAPFEALSCRATVAAV